MAIVDPRKLLDTLRKLPRENEWLEFKRSDFEPERIAKYISGLANSAMLQDEAHGYLVFGVENDTHEVVGTTVRIKDEKIGAEPFEGWIARKLDPRLTLTFVPFDYDNKHVEIVVIEPAYQRPVRVDGEAYIRIEQQLRRLRDYPERERAIWLIASRFVFERGIASVHRSQPDILREFDVRRLLEMLGKPTKSDAAM